MKQVAVICTCYNQADYIEEALRSVVDQTYTNWELIIVDNASTDDSLWKIEQFILKNPQLPIRKLFLGQNIGICKAFNQALALTKADYVIDLAADDVLLPERLESGVKNLETHLEVAVNFTNAQYIDASGKALQTHYPVGPLGRSEIFVPEGHVFEEVIKKYFICSASIMYRASMLKAIYGYDEMLAYEDFDALIRLSHQYKFSYTDKILIQKRKLSESHGAKQYARKNGQLRSTLMICEKIFNLIHTTSQKKALLFRIAYEGKQSLVHLRIKLFFAFCFLGLKTLIKK